jgi:hypothetical protein
MDVHCCNCHSGFLFDIQSCVCINGDKMKYKILKVELSFNITFELTKLTSKEGFDEIQESVNVMYHDLEKVWKIHIFQHKLDVEGIE